MVERANLDGTERTIVVPRGVTVTPKQITYESTTDCLYWSDREGMRVMRSTWDGRDVTVLVRAGSGKFDERDKRRHCVGVAVDTRTTCSTGPKRDRATAMRDASFGPRSISRLGKIRPRAATSRS